MLCGGERPDVETCRKQRGFSSRRFRKLCSADAGEVRCTMDCMPRRRRRRRAHAIWPELLFCRLRTGDWTIAASAWAHGCATRLKMAEAGVADGGFRLAAAPGTASNSATSGANMNRPKCRRLALRVLWPMLHEIQRSVMAQSEVFHEK